MVIKKDAVLNLMYENCKQVNLIYNHDGTELTIEIE